MDRFQKSFKTKEEKRRCIKDMISVYGRHGFGFDEYLLYNFELKDESERLSFVADREHLGYACTLNAPENNIIFDNKCKTYEKFQKYYKRKMILFQNQEQRSEFAEFASDHSSFIIKPLDLSCGNGIMIVESDEHKCFTTWFSELLSQYGGKFIAEELIVRTDAMANLHPSSVNTVRVPTILTDDEVLIVNPFFRVGQGGNCVDNAGAGGIICSVDKDSGEVFAAADEHGRRFTEHPQTSERLVGFQIPKWEEAKELVRELAKVVPSNRYTGWDIALTDEGWVLVEANRRGQFVLQIASQIGFRKAINGILKRLKKSINLNTIMD